MLPVYFCMKFTESFFNKKIPKNWVFQNLIKIHSLKQQLVFITKLFLKIIISVKYLNFVQLVLIDFLQGEKENEIFFQFEDIKWF